MSRDFELMYKSDQQEQMEVCRELAPQGLLHALGQPWKALENALRNRNFENKRLIERVAALEDLAREWRILLADWKTFEDAEKHKLWCQCRDDVLGKTAQLLGEER